MAETSVDAVEVHGAWVCEVSAGPCLDRRVLKALVLHVLQCNSNA